ncbi:MAG: PDZ domain-containing protein [Chitinophagaceae bacterium]|nr:PDZ domain-containing protein [Chitinophagaceae bacterium]
MKHWLLTFSLLASAFFLYAQDFSKGINDAFIVTRMVEKFHLQPKPLNDEFSNNLFYLFLKELDENKILFLEEDIKKLASYRLQLDDAIAKRQTDFLQFTAGIYLQRMKQNDSLIKLICKAPFNFTAADKMLLNDTTYPSSISQKLQRFTHYLKWQVLDEITDDESIFNLSPAAQKKFIDSAEAVQRKQIIARSTKRYAAILEPGKLTTTISNLFCKAVAHCYDPHTSFMPAEEKEAFDEDLGQKPLRFGLGLNENEKGEVTISNLLPGSSAFKSASLNAGDKIIAVQEPGKPLINVSSFTLLQVDSVLNEIKDEHLVLTVKKPDGTTKQTALSKERFATEEDEEDKVQGYVLKGSKNIGYISIPDFYVDWEDDENGIAGCANDVAKEIIKLKKEKIEGLILDIRSNGGGSMQEAIELSGIFIDGGPVGLIKEKTGKPITLKDVNSGTIYDGPLLIMVNGYSASASEMLSGTLQDYNRALIVGTPTYGKATGQVIYPMDTLVTNETIDRFETANYIKITSFGLYRINGTTAQQNGVQPDAELPDLLRIVAQREKDEPFAFSLTPIEPNKYYKPFTALNKTGLKAAAQICTDTALYFKKLAAYSALYNQVKQQKEFSLKLEDVLQYKQKQKNYIDYFENYQQQGQYKVDNYLLHKERLKAGEWLTGLDNEVKQAINTDPYIQICYQLILQIIK